MSDVGHKAEEKYPQTNGGSPQRLLPEDSGQETYPGWSPDGRKIIFVTGRLREAQLGARDFCRSPRFGRLTRLHGLYLMQSSTASGAVRQHGRAGDI